MQCFPAAKHVRVSGDIPRITHRSAVGIHPNPLTEEGVIFGLVFLRVTWITFPEICPIQELKSGASNINRLKTINKSKHLRALRPKELAKLFHKGQHCRTNHHVINHFGLTRDFREVLGKGGLGRRYGNMLQHFATMRLNRGRKIVAVVMAKCKIREHHCDFLTEVVRYKRRHRMHLAFYIGDPRLKRVSVQHTACDMMTFRHHKVRQFQFPGTRCRADDNMRKQRSKTDVTVMLGREFLDHFRATLRIGPIVFCNNLQRTTIDATLLIDQCSRRRCRSIIPSTIGGADTRAVHLEPDFDRLSCLCTSISCPQRHRGCHRST
mmetsp:Transcript_23360/g.40758  ORF Transcript_23360/g.40758 Transcript_23360/m.40758 type:complete len:322 (+) Transcript_23360:679-1644(+)